MCGRYAAGSDPSELVEEFEVEADHTQGRVGPDFNLAPTDTAPVVLTRVPRGTDGPPVRQLRPLVWGLVPSWSKDRRVGVRMINARVEEVLDKSSFRRPVLQRRCLVPATGYFEWHGTTQWGGKQVKQPFLVRRADGQSLAMAGLYEFWRDPTVKDTEDPAAWVTSFTILTRAAEAAMDELHPRMPLVLDRDMWSDWLSPDITARPEVEELLNLGLAAPDGRFELTVVSPQVNNVRHDGPQLLEAADADPGDLLGQ